MDARAYDDRLYVYIAVVLIVSEHRKNLAYFLTRSLSLSLSLSPSLFHAPARPRQAGTLSSHMQDQRTGCSNIRFNSASHARCAWSLSDSSESDGIEEGGETGSVADGVNGIFSIARAI